MFSKVLIANRGEIAVRIARTLRTLGISSVAVYSDADAGALHVRSTDEAVRIGPAAARESYLNVDAVINAALVSGAQAIHPGYGFLSENPALARACEANGLVFIGPPVGAIEAMADKIDAKATVINAGVRVVPGSDPSQGVMTDEQLIAAVQRVGLPVLLKPSAGGGGKGMHVVTDLMLLPEQIRTARREAVNAFGNDTLLVERYLANPRHIEIQVLADTHGNVVHLGERECSLQRRHQKVIEEAPSPFLKHEVRAAMGQQAVDAARACGYVGAGTVEFIMSDDAPDEFFFMEMNTRLQVEHPVTEEIFGIDLVEWQVRVACGEALAFSQADLQSKGHSIEARIYAEDAGRGFLPTGGTVRAWIAPSGVGVRVDGGIAQGSVIGSDYDPMLAKIIAHGSTRTEALTRLQRALRETSLLGLTTNVAFLQTLLADAHVQAGDLNTGLIEQITTSNDLQNPPSDLALAAVALTTVSRTAESPWMSQFGWRHGGRSWTAVHLEAPTRGVVTVWLRPSGQEWDIVVTDVADRLSLEDEARAIRINALDAFALHQTPDGTHVGVDGSSWFIRDHRRGRDERGASSGAGFGPVRSPMPGTILTVDVAVGDSVTVGQRVAVVEAMKMEHTLKASIDGIVSTIHASVGQTVALDAPIVTIAKA